MILPVARCYVLLAAALFTTIALIPARPSRAAGQQEAAGPTWRIGLVPAAMPLVSDTRRYTEEGTELALARALADRLGVVPEFVAIAPANLAAALAEGQVDVALARGDGTRSALTSLPTGYRSGLAAAMRSDTTIRRWQDLRQRTVCVSRAQQDGQALARHYGANIELVDAPAQALVRLRLGGCDASLHDEAQLAALFARAEWQKFSATLPAIAPRDLRLIFRGNGTEALASRTAAAPSESGRPPVEAAALIRATAEEASSQRWQARHATWAANVAFEVYFDQMGPDCH